MIKARILLDSIGIGVSAPRLTTWLLTMPRFILAEFNTHRAISKNCPSSRAIPVEKRIRMALEEPVVPIEWGMNSENMQSHVIADEATASAAKFAWLEARDAAVNAAKDMVELGIHKQIANRLLEPFITVTVLATGTQDGWENFFALRAESAADPHIQKLAYEMLDAYNASTPQVLNPGDWHIPFGDDMPDGLSWDDMIKVAVARSARVSYNNFDGSRDVQKDFKLHDRLAASGHWSAFEHIAQVPDIINLLAKVAPEVPVEELQALRDHLENAKRDPDYSIVCNYNVDCVNLGPVMNNPLSGNLVGWSQLRKTYPNESRKDPRVLGSGC